MQAGLDIGNTRSKLGLFESQQKIKVVNIGRTIADLETAVEQYQIQDLIVSSVSGDLVNDEELVHKLNQFIWLTHNTPLPITLDYHTPETLGRDRVATAVGAWSIYKDEPTATCIIDAGTCITMDIVTGDGRYLGGSICPGITMRLKAMNNFTSNLPFVELKDWEPGLGKTTEEALLLGAGQGVICEIDGFIAKMNRQFSKLTVILTGGDADLIEKKLESKIFLHPELLFVGLREILKFNAD
jgi:type III pantothenate kinase